MKKNSLQAAISMLMLALYCTGCFKVTLNSSLQAQKGTTHDRWTHFFLGGLIGTQKFDARDFCADGQVAQVRTGANLATLFVTGITGFIYSPRKVYITCAEQPNLSLEIDANQKGEPVRVVKKENGKESTGIIIPASGQAEEWQVSFKEGTI